MSLPPGVDLSKIPVMPNPSGAPPDFAHGPSLHDGVLGTGVTAIVVSSIFLIVRLWTNVRVTRRLCLDDLLCIFAFLGASGYWGLNLFLSERGATKHAWDIPLTFMSPDMAKAQVGILFISAPTMWAAKSSILALYIRIFGSVTWLRRTAYFWIVFMAMFYSMNIVVAGVYCIPRKGEEWGGASFARCSTNTWPHIVVGVFSLIADTFILVLPFPVVLRLKIDVRRKIALAMVFATGILIVGLAIASLYFRVQVYNGNDPTWYAALLVIVTVSESFSTIIVSCTPALSSFWHNIFTHTSLWTGIKSSSLYSSLRFRFSQGSEADVRPSFVHSSPRWKTASSSEEGGIQKVTTYQVEEREEGRGEKRMGDDFITKAV